MGRGLNQLILARVLWTNLVILSFAWTGMAFAGVYSVPKHNIEEDANVVKAAEGFTTVPSNNLRSAWNSVYAFYSEAASDIGTAFLIRKKDVGDAIELYFLTNYHVVDEACDERSCDSQLLEDIAFVFNEEGKLSFTESSGLRFSRSIQLVKASVNPDLALLKVRLDKNIPAPKPIDFAANCAWRKSEVVYTIGFPNTSLRTNSNRKVIQKQNVILKRQSQGLIVDEEIIGARLMLTSTVDIVKSSSGGPLLNSQGQLVGVINQMVKGPNNAYMGMEAPHNLLSHSYSVPCELVKEFIDGP